MANEFDDYTFSIEEQQAILDRDQPSTINLNENERLEILESAMQDLIINTMNNGGV
ncbi:hypothetical protein [Terrisporobacter petrolearius]|uniref:hypothetical protein n=1 Tax=Terrisporobacter petrolearius TaxID=1460447 RepID=UPI0031CC8511